jgi:hypothetical protein
MISRRSLFCQLTPRVGVRNRAKIASAVYVAASLGGCSFSERLPGLFDAEATGSTQLSKSETGTRDARDGSVAAHALAPAVADSEIDSVVPRSKAERGRFGEFAADVEGLDRGFCGAAPDPVGQKAKLKPLKPPIVGSRTSESTSAVRSTEKPSSARRPCMAEAKRPHSRKRHWSSRFS